MEPEFNVEFDPLTGIEIDPSLNGTVDLNSESITITNIGDLNQGDILVCDGADWVSGASYIVNNIETSDDEISFFGEVIIGGSGFEPQFERQAMVKITPHGFYANEEKIEDTQDLYNRFNQFLMSHGY
jgi:hypothetical protein